MWIIRSYTNNYTDYKNIIWLWYHELAKRDAGNPLWSKVAEDDPLWFSNFLFIDFLSLFCNF